MVYRWAVPLGHRRTLQIDDKNHALMKAFAKSHHITMAHLFALMCREFFIRREGLDPAKHKLVTFDPYEKHVGD